MPTPKQMEKLAAAVGRKSRTMRTPGPADVPREYWESVPNDPLADAKPERPGLPGRTLRLSEIPQHILRVSCSRCGRIVEIQKADAVRLYGPTAVWKDVGRRLLAQCGRSQECRFLGANPTSRPTARTSQFDPGRVKTFFVLQELHAAGRDPRRRDHLSIFWLYRLWSQSGRNLGPR